MYNSIILTYLYPVFMHLNLNTIWLNPLDELIKIYLIAEIKSFMEIDFETKLILYWFSLCDFDDWTYFTISHFVSMSRHRCGYGQPEVLRTRRTRRVLLSCVAVSLQNHVGTWPRGRRTSQRGHRVRVTICHFQHTTGWVNWVKNYMNIYNCIIILIVLGSNK